MLPDVFSGEESQEYADEASNFSMYNAATIVDLDPSIAPLLTQKFPIAFERDPETGGFFQIDESDDV